MAFTIVAGISSSGKSTYISTVGTGRRVLDNEVGSVDDIPEGCDFHYNTLFYACNNVKHADTDFLEEPVLRSIVRSGVRPPVVYVFCRQDELVRRIRTRETLEDGAGTYPSAAIERFVLGVDYSQFHRRWLDLFNSFAGQVRCVQSTRGGFVPITQRSVLNGGQGAADLLEAAWWWHHGGTLLRTLSARA